MEAWSQRPNRKSSVILEKLLRRVVEEKISGNADAVGLDMTAMYTAVIRNWAKSGEKGAAQRAEEILDNMQSAYEDGDGSLKPNIETFNAVLLAYAQFQEDDAPQQAMRVLQKLHDLIHEGRTDVMPNTESYAAILRAYSAVGKKDAHILVLQLINRMEELSKEGFPSVRPDYKCHKVYIGALSRAITRGYVPGPEYAKKAESYLQEMMASPDENSRPDVYSFNMLISAWSNSGDWETTDRAEALLAQLEAYHVASGYSEKTEPNTNTYNCLIACYSRSTIQDKAERAHAVLERMKIMVEEGFESRRPDAVTYNTVMNAYAKSKQLDAPQQVESLLQEMYHLYETTGRRGLKPSSRTLNTCVSYHYVYDIVMACASYPTRCSPTRRRLMHGQSQTTHTQQSASWAG
jgi:hypothetical protein